MTAPGVAIRSDVTCLCLMMGTGVTSRRTRCGGEIPRSLMAFIAGDARSVMLRDIVVRIVIEDPRFPHGSIMTDRACLGGVVIAGDMVRTLHVRIIREMARIATRCGTGVFVPHMAGGAWSAGMRSR